VAVIALVVDHSRAPAVSAVAAPLRSSENTAGTCPYKGMAYFNSLGWSVILSDGRKTLDVVLSRRANSIRAFD